jgi:hypothetical protein
MYIDCEKVKVTVIERGMCPTGTWSGSSCNLSSYYTRRVKQVIYGEGWEKREGEEIKSTWYLIKREPRVCI